MDNVKPSFDQVRACLTELDNIEEERIEATDELDYLDTLLDNTIKVCSMNTQTFDARSNAAPVFKILFPDGGYSAITHAKPADELVEAEALALRIENLGPGHQLFPEAGSIRAQVEESKKAIRKINDVATKNQNALNNLEIAKSNFREAYNKNFLHASMLLGNDKAETLFNNSF
ncbi:MAG: hypothetical protein HC896_02675 [Bacteroidales bacterium]|nr:hypothetical protein [Bacteroidales bacterium]